MAESKSMRVAYGEALRDIGGLNEKVVVCDADLAHATMTNIFAEKYPERFFNFGIAEANMTCAAAGMAHSGLIPFISTFALFGTGRAYEQIRNSIAYVNANVKVACSHSGLCVGEDGGSHQTVEDIALMRVVPNMTILVRHQGSCVHPRGTSGVRCVHRGGHPLYPRQGQCDEGWL